VTDELEARLQRICEEHGVAALWAFGSRGREALALTRGEAGGVGDGGSDLDVGVLPARGRIQTPKQRVRLAAALEDLFDVPRVDLVIVPRAAPYLAVDVIRGELLVDRDPDATAEFELYVLRRAADLMPFLKMRRELILEEGGR
jgi:predicted nucleotidyltransferase